MLHTETVLQQRALKMGVIQTTGRARTPQQRVLVAYQEILTQTKDAQGDFSRTSGELANSLRTAKAVVIDKAARLGQQLLPVAKSSVRTSPPPARPRSKALEDAEDIRAARAALSDPGPDIPLEDVLDKYADDLTAHPGEPE